MERDELRVFTFFFQECESTRKNWENRTSLPKPEKKIKKKFDNSNKFSYLCQTIEKQVDDWS